MFKTNYDFGLNQRMITHEKFRTKFSYYLPLLLRQIFVRASLINFDEGAFAFLEFIRTSVGKSLRGFFMARWQSGNAADCKSAFHRFKSDPSLQKNMAYNKFENVSAHFVRSNGGKTRRPF